MQQKVLQLANINNNEMVEGATRKPVELQASIRQKLWTLLHRCKDKATGTRSALQKVDQLSRRLELEAIESHLFPEGNTCFGAGEELDQPLEQSFDPGADSLSEYISPDLYSYCPRIDTPCADGGSTELESLRIEHQDIRDEAREQSATRESPTPPPASWHYMQQYPGSAQCMDSQLLGHVQCLTSGSCTEYQGSHTNGVSAARPTTMRVHYINT